jgi:hypothetical protein
MHLPINCTVIECFGWHGDLMFLAALRCHTHLPKSDCNVHSLACALHDLTTFSFYCNSLFVKRLIPPFFKLIITKKAWNKYEKYILKLFLFFLILRIIKLFYCAKEK